MQSPDLLADSNCHISQANFPILDPARKFEVGLRLLLEDGKSRRVQEIVDGRLGPPFVLCRGQENSRSFAVSHSSVH